MRPWVVLGIAAFGVVAPGCRTQGQAETPAARTKGLLAQVRSPNTGLDDVLTVYVDDSAPPQATKEESGRGFILFSRPMTQPLFPAAVPKPGERVEALTIVGDAFAGPLLDALEEKSYDLTSLRLITTGGAFTSAHRKAELLRRLPGVRLLDALGSSESG